MGEKVSEKLNAATVESRWRGIYWPVLSFLGGFFVYFALFKTFVDPVNPQIEALNSSSASLPFSTTAYRPARAMTRTGARASSNKEGVVS